MDICTGIKGSRRDFKSQNIPHDHYSKLTAKNSFFQGSSIRQQYSKILNITPPKDIPNLQLHMKQIPVKKTKNYLSNSYTLGERKKTTSKQAGETETSSHHKSKLWCMDP